MQARATRTVSFACLCFAGVLFVSVRYAISNAHEAPRHNDTSEGEYPTSVPPVPSRRDLSGNIAADRPLSVNDLDLLLRLSDWLIDKRRRSGRSRAAQDLGRLGHKYAIPALMAVARDEAQRDNLRSYCVIALSMIRDKRVVDFLIEEALGTHPDLDGHALSGLVHLVGKPPELHDVSFAGSVKHPPKDPKEREEYLNVWRKWWKENRDKVKLGRGGQSIYQ